eukprot:gene6869-9523_t
MDIEPWKWAVASICVFFSASLAVGAGIGGGALFVAIFMIVLGMDAHSAVPLSKATIFGLAIAAYSVNITKRHPLSPARSLIDYDTALMLEPMTLLGAIAGVLLNVLLPNWLVLIPLCILLSIISYRTIKKGIRLHKQEHAAANKNTSNRALISQEQDDLPNSASQEQQYEDRNGCNHSSRSIDQQGNGHVATENETSEDQSQLLTKMILDAQDEELDKIYKRESRIVPWEKLASLIIVWLGYTCITMLLYQADDVIRPCSPGWIVLLMLSIPYVVGVTFFSGSLLKKQTQRKRVCGYKFLSGDVIWEGKNLNKYPSLAFFAGVAAAMMGIGGGMVKSPIMLAMGLQPQVVTTTSSFMIIFTSSATTLQYLVLGKIKPEQLGIMLSMGFCGALLGQRVVNHLIAMYKKQSLLVFLLGGLTIVSGIVIVATSLATEDFRDVRMNTDQVCRLQTNNTDEVS